MESQKRVVTLTGGPYERGYLHGEQLSSLIADTLRRWKQSLAVSRKVNPDDFIKNFIQGTPYRKTVATQFPDLYEEIQGISEGSNQSFEDVFSLNMLDEEWWFSDNTDGTGCSLLGVTRESLGTEATLLAQNMDLPAFLDGSQAVLKIETEGGVLAILTIAGMIGLTGATSRGFAICVNTLLDLAKDDRGVPVAIVLREVLNQQDSAAACERIQQLHHASGQHYAIASKDEIVGFECSADGVVKGSTSEGVLLHTNHPLWQEIAEKFDQGNRHYQARLNRSSDRLTALESGLDRVKEQKSAKTILASSENGLCVYPTTGNESKTFGSVEYELGEQVVMNVALGQPDHADWISFELNKE